MKIKTINRLLIYSLLLGFTILGVGCKDEYSVLIDGYIVGTFIADEVNGEGQSTGKKTDRGYCILLEENKDIYDMSFFTFNFPDNLVVFPSEVLSTDYSGIDCGPYFFPDSLKRIYKIKFKYKNVNEKDRIRFITGPCNTMDLSFPWENYDEVILREIFLY